MRIIICLLLAHMSYGQIIVTNKCDKRLIIYNDSIKAYKNNIIFKKNAIALLKKCRTREEFFDVKAILGFDDCQAIYKNGGLYKNGVKYEFYLEVRYDYRGMAEAWSKIVPYPKMKVIYKPIQKEIKFSSEIVKDKPIQKKAIIFTSEEEIVKDKEYKIEYWRWYKNVIKMDSFKIYNK